MKTTKRVIALPKHGSHVLRKILADQKERRDYWANVDPATMKPRVESK